VRTSRELKFEVMFVCMAMYFFLQMAVSTFEVYQSDM